MCGTLQCQGGSGSPTMQSTFASTTFSRITLKKEGEEYECKNLNSPNGDQAAAQLELVRDGTRCEDKMVIMQQDCL